MELMDAIHARRATREYTSEPVAVATINRLIEAATWAPSAVNTQSWMFTIVRDQKLLDEISSKSKQHMLYEIEADAGHAGFRDHLSSPEFHIFYHAPVLILISAPKTNMWSAEDATLAAENLMLAATGAGLGTCWIGFAQRWLETDAGRRTVDLPTGYRPVAPIIVGHPKAPMAPVPRKPPTVHWIG